jgi:hypothetical protein
VDWLGTLFLYLHIGGVIVAFGPTIALPFIGAKAAQEPMHGNFALRVSDFIGSRVVEPVAIFVFLTGVGLIITRGYNPLEQLWLAVAIVLFLITFAYANLVQGPTVRKMIAMTSQPPPPAPAGEAPAGPPPEFVALSTKAARGGMFMLAMLFIILALMVVKPF